MGWQQGQVHGRHLELEGELLPSDSHASRHVSEALHAQLILAAQQLAKS
jgi:hypothetical protein